MILQDKTGTLDAKIWDPNSQGIDDFDAMDYIEIMGDVTSFAGALQISIKRARKAGEENTIPGITFRSAPATGMRCIGS